MLSGIDAGHKRLLEGSHRTRAPAETLAQILPIRQQFGITRVANVTGLDRIGLPVVLATRPNSRSVAVSQGKGTSLEAAKASAMMEAIELWHAENILRPMIFATPGEIGRCGTVIDLERLPRVVNSRYSEGLRMHWIEGIDLVSGKPVFIPHEMVHADYTHPVPPGHGCFPGQHQRPCIGQPSPRGDLPRNLRGDRARRHHRVASSSRRCARRHHGRPGDDRQ